MPGRPSCFFFSIGPINKNFVEDVEILLPVNIRWIPLQSKMWKVNDDRQRKIAMVHLNGKKEKHHKTNTLKTITPH